MNRTMNDLSAHVKLRNSIPPPTACRALRVASGVSAAELADAVGVTAGAVLMWERGLRRPRGRNRDQYAKALRALEHATRDV